MVKNARKVKKMVILAIHQLNSILWHAIAVLAVPVLGDVAELNNLVLTSYHVVVSDSKSFEKRGGLAALLYFIISKQKTNAKPFQLGQNDQTET